MLTKIFETALHSENSYPVVLSRETNRDPVRHDPVEYVVSYSIIRGDRCVPVTTVFMGYRAIQCATNRFIELTGVTPEILKS